MELASSSRGRVTVGLALACSALAALPASAHGAGTGSLVRVVVTAPSQAAADVAGVAAAVRAAGGRVLDELSLIGGVSAELPSGAVLAPGLRVAPDRVLRVSGHEDGTDGAGASAGGGSHADGTAAAAATLRATLGLGPVTGARGRHGSGAGGGVTVAVVDTGVADVADLAGRVTHVDVTGTATRGARDGYGHGTFVAGVVAGDGSSSDGRYSGVAPRAHILDVRVADSSGGTDLVTVLRGLQAVRSHPDVRVLNLSLSSDSPLPYQLDPLTIALEALWRDGVTVVVPAGNGGPGTLSSPGVDPVLVTVGALDENGTADRGDDTVASWSGTGPAPQGVAKPDLVAPGAHVVSLRAPGSVIDLAHPASRVDGSYFRGSGTSFSTAAAAGAVADLLSSRSGGGLAPDQVKDLLVGTAYAGQALSDVHAAGAGGLDAGAALTTDWPDVPHPSTSAVQAIPGDPAVWAVFVEALLTGDRAVAASSWSRLSAEARNWAASSWSLLSPEARNWAASSWSDALWAGPDGTADEWLARNWAARNWAARNWAASSWSASSWSARNWAASSWSARNWAGSSWSARNWAGSSWSARNWAGSSWSARNWSATDWG